MFPSNFRNSNSSFKINHNEVLGISTSCDIFITVPALVFRKQINIISIRLVLTGLEMGSPQVSFTPILLCLISITKLCTVN